MKGKKKEIVEAAIKRFSHFGISKTNMNEIADDLNITKANLYYYYNDKIALITDVIETVLEEIKEEGFRIFENHSGKQVEELLESYLDYRIDLKKKYHMLYQGEGVEFGLNDKVILDAMNRATEYQVSVIKKIFEAGVKNGTLEIEDSEDSARLYCEIIDALDLKQNIGNLVRCFPMEEDFDQIKTKQLKATNLILGGLKSKIKTEI